MPRFAELRLCQSTKELLASPVYREIEPAVRAVLDTPETGDFSACAAPPSGETTPAKEPTNRTEPDATPEPDRPAAGHSLVGSEVLDLMVKHYSVTHVTQAEADAAKREKLSFQATQQSLPLRAPWFVEYVRQRLVARFGQHCFDTCGLVVQTTLDLNLEDQADQLQQQQASADDRASMLDEEPWSGEELSGAQNVSARHRLRAGRTSSACWPHSPRGARRSSSARAGPKRRALPQEHARSRFAWLMTRRSSRPARDYG